MFAELKKRNRDLINDYRSVVAKYTIGRDVKAEARQMYRRLQKSMVKLDSSKMNVKERELFDTVALAKIDINAQVLDSNTLGYVLDSAKPRIGSNVVSLVKVKCNGFKKGDIVSLTVGSIQPKNINGYWGVQASEVTLGKKVQAKFANTTKEILHKAASNYCLDCNNSMVLGSLKAIKLLREEPMDSLSLKQEAVKKFFETKLIKSDTKQLAYGIVYAPDVVDSQGDSASAEEIEVAAHEFGWNNGAINYQHQTGPIDEVRVVESWIAPHNMTLGDQQITKGTWLMTVKVQNPELWKMIESDEITGFSMEGTGEKVNG